MEKLIVCVMGAGDSINFLPMCIQSVETADDLFYLDSGNTDGTSKYLKEKNIKTIYRKYDEEDKHWNGKQRNFYLKYLKENYPDDWALCLDADEVVEDLSKIKEFIQTAVPMLYNVKMRHLIQDLSHEDAMTPVHYVPRRLFPISEADFYPEVEHPLLEPLYNSDKPENPEAINKGNPLMVVKKEEKYAFLGATDCTTIWHLAYIPNLWDYKKRYENHLKKSNMHTLEFLKKWYHSHLFGQYPKKEFDPLELPNIILNEFGVDKDEFYFANRGLELKHFLEIIEWGKFFKGDTAILFGCGRGPRVYAMENLGWDTRGVELSEFAVKHKFHDNVVQGNVLDYNEPDGDFYLSIAYDLLEHLDYGDLDMAISTLITFSYKYILISVPVVGDPNLDNDPTHKIHETKEWWIKQFTDKGLKLIKTPDHFLFKEQVIIFEK